MKFNFKSKGNLIIIAVTVFSLTGCENFASRKTTVSNELGSSEPYDNQTIVYQSDDTSLSDQMTDSIVKPEPTGFADYTDPTMPHGQSISQNDYEQIINPLAGLLVANGMENPQLIKTIREYYSDDTLTLDDVNYLTYVGHTGNSQSFQEFIDGILEYKTLDVDFVRYVMSKNNIRFWTNEIEYKLTCELFPEYTSLYEYDLSSYYDFLYNNSEHEDFMKSIKYQPMIYDLEDNFYQYDPEDVQYLCYYNLIVYNMNRHAVTYGDQDGVKFGRAEDNLIVMTPTQAQYNKYNNGLHSLPNCENIDILKVESREELIASLGEDNVEFYDEVYDYIVQLADEYRLKNSTQENTSLDVIQTRQG